MYTSMMALVLAVQVAAAAEVSWTQDYGNAQKQSTSQNKPMAVVLSSGEQGYTQIGLSKEALDQLAANYVCVYVDTANPKNKDLVAAFQMPGAKGIVLSDRTGLYELYRQEGMLSSTDMTAKLKQYSATPVTTSSSYYRGTEGSAATPGYYPAYDYGFGGGYGGCPTCGGGRR